MKNIKPCFNLLKPDYFPFQNASSRLITSLLTKGIVLENVCDYKTIDKYLDHINQKSEFDLTLKRREVLTFLKILV